MSQTIMLVLLCSGLLWAAPEGVGQSLERPVPINATIPGYPPKAKQERKGGVVLVDVRVSAERDVTEAVALMGEKYLRDAATKAARTWRFRPLQSGSSSPYTVRLTFIFHAFSYEPPEKKPDFRSPYQIEILYDGFTARHNKRLQRTGISVFLIDDLPHVPLSPGR